MNRPSIALLGLAALGLTCVAAPLAAEPAPTAPATSARSALLSDIAAAMDKSADPCQDFYRYACGGWLDKTPLPADQARWTRSFSTITERNREIVRAILEDAAARPGGDPDRQRVGDFYGACMDEAAIDRAGLAPLQPLLAEIDAVREAASLLATAGKLQRMNADVLFGLGVLPDFKDPGTDIAFMVQGGLGMPERDYYVSTDAKKQELMKQYEAHVARLLALAGAGAEAAAADAKAIVAFETELAKASRPNTEMRKAEKLYNRLDAEGLKKLTPTLPWSAYFAAIGQPAVTQINVATPEFFEALAKLVAATPLATQRAYLRWTLVNQAADLLPKPFVEANFEFYGKTLSGQAEIQPRWKRCVAATNAALGEAIGKVFVAEHFAGDSKAKALEMIGDIEDAFEVALPRLAWMDETTRARALEKAEAVSNKIGYPDRWRDYSRVTIRRGDHFGNAVAAAGFEFDRQAAKIGKPVDRDEWRMTPQMVNAYYNPLQNEIAFPAGIMQPPFFHRELPAAVNYGGIGAVIGHELSHGFDDMGRKFDPKGVQREWWEPAVAERFEKQASCVKEFYGGFEVEPGYRVNGELTLGENIADVGGLKQAYAAYKAWEKRHGAPQPAVAGLSNDQLFFVSWGQVWCTVASPEFLRRQVSTDPHSPGRFRAIGAPMQNSAFAEAFGCSAGAPMRPANQCTVW